MNPRWALALLLATGLLVAGCGEGPDEGAGDGRLALVSGRDDHGLLALPEVPVYDAPEGDHVVGRIPDGTLVSVTEGDGQWLRVRTVEPPQVDGWVDDFHLRGQVRLVGPAPTCESRVAGETRDGGTLATVWQVRGAEVLVTTLTEPVRRGWAPRADVQELPPQGDDCGSEPPEARHTH